MISMINDTLPSTIRAVIGTSGMTVIARALVSAIRLCY